METQGMNVHSEVHAYQYEIVPSANIYLISYMG